MKFKQHPFFWFVAGSLAVWRITNIIQQEEIAAPVRKAVGIVEPDGEDPEHWIYPDSFLGKLFYCFWCGSIWSATLITILILLFPPLILPFALSAAAIAFKQYIEQEPPVYIENLWTNDDSAEQYGDLGEDDAGT